VIGNFKNGETDYRPKGNPRRVNMHDFEDKKLGKVVHSSFFVSTEMMGCCCACAAMTFELICSNWAFRSGCFEPSSALPLRRQQSGIGDVHTLLERRKEGTVEQ
jgi:hypothetical protein